MRYRTLRGFLMASPRPAAVRLSSGSSVNTLTREPSMTWARFAETIDAMEPERIEVLGAVGEVMRATRLEDFEEYAEDEDAEAPAVVSRSSALATQASLDAETERFRLFSNHIAEAYRFGYETAFSKLCQIADIMGKRGEALERSLAATERLLRSAVEENIEQKIELAQAMGNGEGGGFESALVQAFAAGQNQAAATKANGKGTPQ